MTPARTAIAALLLLGGATSAKAQDPAGAVPGRSTATGQTEPARGEPVVRPKRGRLIDMIKAIAPPLIEAATSRPAPAPEPVPEPVVPAEPIAAPALPSPGTVFAPPPQPRPRPVKVEPRPSAPRPLPTVVASRPAAPVARPAPAPISPPPVEAPPPLPQTPAPVAAEAIPRPAPVAPTEVPPPAVEPESSAPTWGVMAVTLLGLLAALVIAAGALHLRRVRQIARTRAALALKPRLDLAAGACSTSGLSLSGPPLSISARLLATDHG